MKKFLVLFFAVLSAQAFALEDGRYHSEQLYCDLLVVSSENEIITQGTARRLDSGGETVCPSNEVQVYRLAVTGNFHLTVPNSDRLYKHSFIMTGKNMLMLQHISGGEITKSIYRKIE